MKIVNEESAVFILINIKARTGLIPSFFFENIKMITIYHLSLDFVNFYPKITDIKKDERKASTV